MGLEISQLLGIICPELEDLGKSVQMLRKLARPVESRATSVLGLGW